MSTLSKIYIVVGVVLFTLFVGTLFYSSKRKKKSIEFAPCSCPFHPKPHDYYADLVDQIKRDRELYRGLSEEESMEMMRKQQKFCQQPFITFLEECENCPHRSK